MGILEGGFSACSTVQRSLPVMNPLLCPSQLCSNFLPIVLLSNASEACYAGYCAFRNKDCAQKLIVLLEYISIS